MKKQSAIFATHSTQKMKLSGKAFDKAYISQMVKHHTAVVAALKHAPQTSKDADFKGWAANIVPTAEEHLKMAKDLNAKLSRPAEKKKWS